MLVASHWVGWDASHSNLHVYWGYFFQEITCLKGSLYPGGKISCISVTLLDVLTVYKHCHCQQVYTTGSQSNA